MDTTSTGKIGKYTILGVLGRGGMGEVLLARDEDLGRRVAIKRPFRAAMEQGAGRFQVEARAATLHHPNIPAVYEMGEQDGLPFIAMEYVEGETLEKIVKSGRQLDLLTKLSIIEQVCLALGHAHEKGIIHRDIKPANVIVQPDGVAKIIDFGIAKIQNLEMTTGLTQTSQIIGTLHYIAPERFKGESVDGRADIFSAGVLLYLLLTGVEPFGGAEATASYKIVNEAHASLGSHLHDYPTELDAILDKALAKDPFDRYQTAEDFADALHEVIEEQKRGLVFKLFDDAERLATESRYAPALELLEEAIRLDPANTQVRKLRKMVREHQERQKRGDRVRDFVRQADSALVAENYAEALNALKEAQRLDPTAEELPERIRAVEDQKRRAERTQSALTEAELVRGRGDVTGALRIVEKALAEDPESTRLVSLKAVIARHVEEESQRAKVLQVVDAARRELVAQHIPAAEQLLLEAEALDASHPRVDELRREITQVKDREDRRQLIEEIQRRVEEFVRADKFEPAIDLLCRAVEKLPQEIGLQRLKRETETQARRYESKRFVETTVVRAKDLFETSPAEAMALLRKALEGLPEEERLVACERTLQQRLDERRMEKQRTEALGQARGLIDAKQFEKAIGVLEAFELEFGAQPDVSALLGYAREEQAGRQRSSTVERSMAEARSLIQADRHEEAIRVLQTGFNATSDAGLARLLEETREHLSATTRKVDVLQKRVALLRERGELDTAIELLQAEMAAMPPTPAMKTLLSALLAERQQKAATVQALATARDSGRQKEFSTGIQALQSVLQAYGDSAQVSQELKQLEADRGLWAQEVVDTSLRGAREELLLGKPDRALAALKGSTAWVEFADAQRQADWQRMSKSVKDDLSRKLGWEPKNAVQSPGVNPASVNSATGSSSAVTAAAPPQPRSKWPLWAGLGLLVLGGAGYAAMQFLNVKKTILPAEGRIIIAKAPPNATVNVDGYAPVQTDANGDATITVKPGKYSLTVSKDGYSPFKDDEITVAPGETYRDPAQLAMLPPEGTSGTLVIHGNVPKVKVYVDDVYKGTFADGSPIPLEGGPHSVRYSAKGYADSPKKDISIELNKEASDTYNLAALPPPPPNLGNLTVRTNPGAHVALDGLHKGDADANGSLTVKDVKPGKHSLDVTLEGFVAAQRKDLEVAAGKNASVDVQLAPLPATIDYFRANPISIDEGQSVTLSWKVDNATGAVVLEPVGNVKPADSLAVTPDRTTTYRLAASGGTVQQSLTVIVRPKATVQPTTDNADLAGIRTAIIRFITAFQSRNIGTLRKEWPNMGKVRQKQIEQVFKSQGLVLIKETCAGQPTISGSSAEWHCVEYTQFTKDVWENMGPKTLYFNKKGDRWSFRDKQP